MSSSSTAGVDTSSGDRRTIDGSPDEFGGLLGAGNAQAHDSQAPKLPSETPEAARHEMIAAFAWPAMQQSPGMHHLPPEVKDYFSAATDAAEAAPATTSASKCTPGYKLRSKGKGTKQDQNKLSRNKNEKGPARPPGYSNKRPK